MSAALKALITPPLEFVYTLNKPCLSIDPTLESDGQQSRFEQQLSLQQCKNCGLKNCHQCQRMKE